MSRIHVMLNTFEPALTDNNWRTSMAGGMWLAKLIENLARYDIQVNNISVAENSMRQKVFDAAVASATSYDLILLYLRWPMEGEQYKMRQAAYERQLELVDVARKHNLPVLIFNGDLMGTGYDLIDGVHHAMYMPALAPWVNYKTLHFPCPFEIGVFGRVPPEDRTIDFCYVGNDFKIYDQVRDFLLRNSINGKIYGPWPEKHDAAKLAYDFRNIEFMGRLDQRQLFDVLEQSYHTRHFAKPEYLTCGFIAQRWYEAALAGVVASADKNQYCDRFENLKCFDYEFLPRHSSNLYGLLLRKQQLEVMRMCGSFLPWVEAITNLTEGGVW